MHNEKTSVFRCFDVPEMKFATATSNQISTAQERIRVGINELEDRSDIIADAMYTTLNYGYKCPHSSIELGLAPCDECETVALRIMHAPQFAETWDALEQMYWSELAKTLNPVAGIQ